MAWERSFTNLHDVKEPHCWKDCRRSKPGRYAALFPERVVTRDCYRRLVNSAEERTSGFCLPLD